MRKPQVYLSIDCDYWRTHESPESCLRFFNRVWGVALDKSLPIYTVLYHHHLLPHINASDCNVLVNIDYHSDLADIPTGHTIEFSEGTWGNFVDWRREGTFIWRYPVLDCVDTSLGCHDGYCHDQQNPFDDPQVARWRAAKKRLGLYGIAWDHIEAIGVCLSPNWIGRTNVIAEPLQKLRIGRWLREYDRAANKGDEPRNRMPKFVRPKAEWLTIA